MYLGAGSVVVQSGQAGEVLFRDGWSRLGGDQTVGICGVSNHQNLSGWDPNISDTESETISWICFACSKQMNKTDAQIFCYPENTHLFKKKKNLKLLN